MFERYTEEARRVVLFGELEALRKPFGQDPSA